MGENLNLQNFFDPKSSKYFLGFFLIAGLYLIFGRLGLLFDAVSGFASLVWAPAGIAIATVYIFGFRYAPAIFLGAFLTNLTAGAPPLVALGIGVGNTLEALLAVKILKYFFFDPFLRRPRDAVILFLPAIFLGTLVSAVIGVTSLHLGGLVYSATYFDTWIAWWVGDMIGALVFAPVIMIWAKTFQAGFKFKRSLLRYLELLFSFSLIMLVNFLIFFAAPGSPTANRSFIYLVFIPIIWISFRFKQLGAVTSIFLTSIIAIWGTASGTGPFIGLSLNQSLIALQLFMGTVSITMLILSATVSERTEALDALKNEDRRLAQEKARTEAVFLSIGEGIVVTDTEGKIVMVNKAFEDMLLWKKEEVIGRRFIDVVPKETESGSKIPLEDQLISRLLSGEATRTLEDDKTHVYYFVRKDKTKFPVSMIVNAISNVNLEGIVIAFRDITKDREVDKAKTEFVSLASHQLRTPATNMKWFLEMIRDGEVGALNPKQQEYFEEVYKNNRRMIVLINTILNVSRIELGIFEVTPEATDIRKLIGGVLDEHKTQIESKNLSLREFYAENLSGIFIDPKLIRIVLHNIVSNAIKYTRAKGKIKIEVSLKGMNENIGGRTLKKDSMIIAITDTGYGIPKDQWDKIFTRLFRADNVVKKDTDGTGLGLYLAKLIVDHSEGELWFTSELNRGTTFYLALLAQGMKKRKGMKEITVGMS